MKTYVNVVAVFDTAGNIRPTRIIWKDEAVFEIDRIQDIRYATALKSGGAGLRYTCFIRGHCRYLYYENGAWYVESKK